MAEAVRAAGSRRDVIVVRDAAALASEGAWRVRTAIAEAVSARGRCTIALAGGRTPRGLYEALVAAPGTAAAPVPWHAVHVFFGDERHVPPDHADSNYRMAHEALLSRVPVPAAQVHRVPAEQADAAQAAADYAQTIRTAFAIEPGAWPRFDVVLLGMGADGHTASLFPGTAALDVDDRIAVAVRVEAQQATRISLTFPVLNHARAVFVLVSGADKAATLAAVLEDEGEPRFPIQHVHPADGTLVWLVDEAAANFNPELRSSKF